MASNKVGNRISEVEVLNVSPHGFWILVGGEKEYFLDYENFPWFKSASIYKIFNVQLLHGHHLHWADLDVDLDVESLDALESYPLVFS